MKVYWILLFGVWVNLNCKCQDLKQDDVNLERLMDEIFPVQDEDFDYAELYEIYAQRLLNPLNINTATEEQLRSLSILSTSQVNEFIKYREQNGPILSLYELQVIPTFTEPVIRLIRPFLSADQESTGWKNLLKRVWKEDNNYIVSRVEKTQEKKTGYTESASSSTRYQGSPIKIYNRFRVSSGGDFSLGFSFEKDAGEKMTWSPSTNHYGFDYSSAHLQIQNKGFLNNLIVGDYQAQFGQGLALGGGFGMGKGSETITTMRRGNVGFVPYTSVAEYGFFRGIAVSAILNKALTIHSFYSQSKIDGNSSSPTDTPEIISSLTLTGFHRTQPEIESRKNIREVNFGGVLQFKKQGTDAGIIFHQTSFSTPIVRNQTLYNQFAFNGPGNTNVGFYWNQSINNFSLFAEASHSLGHGTGGIIGALASISSALDLSLLYRRFDKGYYTFYSNAVAESSSPQNENGIYWGWKYRFSKIHSASGYIDVFHFPWLRFRSYRPSEGSEWMLRYNYTPSKNVQLFAQVRQEMKVKNLGENTSWYTTGTGTKTNYWINADYKVSTELSFKTRLQIVSYNLGGNSSSGTVLMQDLNYRWRKFRFSCRVALFGTDNYDTRLYLYERDAWLSFSVPAFQGVGIREYILVQYKLNRKTDLWLRWAKTEYENQETIGSGSELINGNRENDFKVQLRIRL